MLIGFDTDEYVYRAGDVDLNVGTTWGNSSFGETDGASYKASNGAATGSTLRFGISSNANGDGTSVSFRSFTYSNSGSGRSTQNVTTYDDEGNSGTSQETNSFSGSGSGYFVYGATTIRDADGASYAGSSMAGDDEGPSGSGSESSTASNGDTTGAKDITEWQEITYGWGYFGDEGATENTYQDTTTAYAESETNSYDTVYEGGNKVETVDQVLTVVPAWTTFEVTQVDRILEFGPDEVVSEPVKVSDEVVKIEQNERYGQVQAFHDVERKGVARQRIWTGEAAPGELVKGLRDEVMDEVQDGDHFEYRNIVEATSNTLEQEGEWVQVTTTDIGSDGTFTTYFWNLNYETIYSSEVDAGTSDLEFDADGGERGAVTYGPHSFASFFLYAEAELSTERVLSLVPKSESVVVIGEDSTTTFLGDTYYLDAEWVTTSFIQQPVLIVPDIPNEPQIETGSYYDNFYDGPVQYGGTTTAQDGETRNDGIIDYDVIGASVLQLPGLLKHPITYGPNPGIVGFYFDKTDSVELFDGYDIDFLFDSSDISTNPGSTLSDHTPDIWTYGWGGTERTKLDIDGCRLSIWSIPDPDESIRTVTSYRRETVEPGNENTYTYQVNGIFENDDRDGTISSTEVTGVIPEPFEEFTTTVINPRWITAKYKWVRPGTSTERTSRQIHFSIWDNKKSFRSLSGKANVTLGEQMDTFYKFGRLAPELVEDAPGVLQYRAGSREASFEVGHCGGKVWNEDGSSALFFGGMFSTVFTGNLMVSTEAGVAVYGSGGEGPAIIEENIPLPYTEEGSNPWVRYKTKEETTFQSYIGEGSDQETTAITTTQTNDMYFPD